MTPRDGQLTGYPRPRPESSSGSQAEPQQGGGHSHSSDPLDWLREAVPGEPGLDYPIYSSPPNTEFSCGDRQGLFADPGAECQVWHVCLDSERQWSMLCPNGTIFNQEIFTCVWWFDFDCTSAESLYSLNDDLYQENGGSVRQSSSGGGGSGRVKPTSVGGSKSGNNRGQSGGRRKGSGNRPARPSPSTVTKLLVFPEEDEEPSQALPLYGVRRGREEDRENPFYDYI